MPFPTLLFYSVASFFLGLVAIAAGGASALQSMFALSTDALPESHEPWQTLLNMLVVAVPLVFLVLALLAAVARPADAPVTAAHIRDLVASLERPDDPGGLAPGVSDVAGGRVVPPEA